MAPRIAKSEANEMTVERAEVIDGLGIDKTTGASMLTIADHLSWDEPLQYHQDCLERKLSAYVQFVESRQLHEHHPDATAPTILILMLHRPSEHGLALLKSAETTLADRGLLLQYGTAPDGYATDN